MFRKYINRVLIDWNKVEVIVWVLAGTCPVSGLHIQWIFLAKPGHTA